MLAPFAYFGGKTRLAPTIAGLLPAHVAYVEPFCGSAAVLFAKRPSRVEVINDADETIVNFFHCLRADQERLEYLCALSPHSRVEFNSAHLDEPVDDWERARRFWVRVNQSFGKTATTWTGWSVGTENSASIPASIRTGLGRFAACASRLANVTLESGDAIDIIGRFDGPNTVLYVDPPYLASTRRGNRDGSVPSDYRIDMGRADDHERLASALNACTGKIVLSGYRTAEYDAWFDGWHRLDIEVACSSSNARTRTRAGRVESMWCNFDPDIELRLF